VPSALAPPVVLLVHVAVAVAVGVTVRWRGRSAYEGAAGDAETAGELGRFRRRGVLVGGAATVVVTRLSGLARTAGADAAAAVADAVGPAVGAVAGVTAAVAVYALPVVVVAVAVRLATVPYRRAVRGFSVRYRDAAAWELERDGVGFAGILVAAGAIALVPAGWPRIAAAVGLGLVATALTPFALVVALRTRWPTDDERAAVGGVLPDGVRLRVVDDRTRLGSAVAAGAALGVASVAPDVALVAIIAGAPPFAVLLAWVVRRTEAQADAYAAEAVGGPALAGALETLADRRYIVEGGRPARILSHHPPLGERIDRLRERAPGSRTG